MDIVAKRRVKGGNGNMAAETCDIVDRSCSWAYGADASYEAIEAEGAEQDKAFGIPRGDTLSNPASGNPSGMEKLSNPHNFSSNPGFMSTAGMLRASAPANGDGVIRGTSARGPLQRGPSSPSNPFSR